MGQNFSWPEQIGHRLDRQGVRRQREQETCTTKTELFAFASRTKAKAKPRRPSTVWSSSRTTPILERTSIDIEQEDYSPIAYPVSKQLSTLLRHGNLPREDDGAIEFWRVKDDLQNEFVQSQYWSDDVWKSKMAGGGGNKKRFQYCTDPSGQGILFISELFKVIQDAIPLILHYRTIC